MALQRGPKQAWSGAADLWGPPARLLLAQLLAQRTTSIGRPARAAGTCAAQHGNAPLGHLPSKGSTGGMRTRGEPCSPAAGEGRHDHAVRQLKRAHLREAQFGCKQLFGHRLPDVPTTWAAELADRKHAIALGCKVQ